MNVKVEKQPKSQLQLTVTVENVKVKEIYKEVLDKAVQETIVDGFRKGNAPREKVEQHVGVSKLYGDTIDALLQKYYTQAIKENLILPISNPKVEIKEFDVEKDFEFIAKLAVKPEIKIKPYLPELKKYYEEKQKAITKENEEKLKKGEDIGHDHAHLHSNEIIEVLLKNAELEIPELLVEEETTRMLTRLVEEIMSAGMKVEDYIKAQKTTIEEIKKNYNKVAEKNIAAELILNELTKQENVEVTEKEIEDTINAVENEESRKQLNTPVQKIYIKSILEKNKLIDSIVKKVEGENNHE